MTGQAGVDSRSRYRPIQVLREKGKHPMSTATSLKFQSTVTTPEHAVIGHVTSHDGTVIGYRRLGRGPGVVLLHGTMTSGQDFTELAEHLSDAFTVYLPDRRGRGLSGPFGIDYGMRKEVEDLDALLTKTGVRQVYGVSAGGLICLQAALTLPAIQKIALYEPALLPAGTALTGWLARFDQEMAQGKVAEALVTSMKGLRLGGAVLNAMPRRLLVSLTTRAMKSEDTKAKDGEITMRMFAPTLHYDGRLLAEMAGTVENFKAVKAEVLLLSGSKGLTWARAGLDPLARVLPHVVKRVEFPGLEHGGSNNLSKTNRGAKPEMVAQELRRFLAS
jgi:pimeloyl-ACP methyl ester carboxylesterase